MRGMDRRGSNAELYPLRMSRLELFFAGVSQEEEEKVVCELSFDVRCATNIFF